MASLLKSSPENIIEPWITLDVPNSTIGDTIFSELGVRIEGSYGILPPNPQFFVDASSALLADFLFGALVSFFLYHHVLTTEKRKTSGLTPFIIGFGVIVPACFLLPYAYIDATGIQNSGVRFTLCAPSVLYAFRCVEAMFGFTPPAALASPITYAIYYAFPVEFMFDHKTGRQLKSTAEDIKRGVIFVSKHLTILLISLCILSPSTFEPFQTMNSREESLMSVRDYLDIRHLANCFIIAIMFQQILTVCGATFATIVHSVTGYKAVEMMRNPMLEATSPSDFWGRRWNIVVHGSLKRGVFKPVRRYSSTFLASLAAFIASGLFHEYLVHAVLIYNKEPKVSNGYSCQTLNSEYIPQLGSNLAFFAWNGVVMVIEKLLGRHRIFKSFGMALPRFMVTFLIIMTALPVAHWFGNPYIKHGMFCDFQEGFPFVTKIA